MSRGEANIGWLLPVAIVLSACATAELDPRAERQPHALGKRLRVLGLVGRVAQRLEDRNQVADRQPLLHPLRQFGAVRMSGSVVPRRRTKTEGHDTATPAGSQDSSRPPSETAPSFPRRPSR